MVACGILVLASYSYTNELAKVSYHAVNTVSMPARWATVPVMVYDSGNITEVCDSFSSMWQKIKQAEQIHAPYCGEQ